MERVHPYEEAAGMPAPGPMPGEPMYEAPEKPRPARPKAKSRPRPKAKAKGKAAGKAVGKKVAKGKKGRGKARRRR